jgi:hypothetical protein
MHIALCVTHIKASNMTVINLEPVDTVSRLTVFLVYGSIIYLSCMKKVSFGSKIKT